MSKTQQEKKEIRVKIYGILEEKYGIMPSELIEFGVRKMMKELSEPDELPQQKHKITPQPKRFSHRSNQPEVRVWRNDE